MPLTLATELEDSKLDLQHQSRQDEALHLTCWTWSSAAMHAIALNLSNLHITALWRIHPVQPILNAVR